MYVLSPEHMLVSHQFLCQCFLYILLLFHTANSLNLCLKVHQCPSLSMILYSLTLDILGLLQNSVFLQLLVLLFDFLLFSDFVDMGKDSFFSAICPSEKSKMKLPELHYFCKSSFCKVLGDKDKEVGD